MEARQLIEERGTVQDSNYVRLLTRKWAPLLEGVQAPMLRASLAMLAENQMRQIEHLTEESFSSNAGAFTKFIFPLLRRVFPNLIANQLVSVQPLSAPVGAVFYYEYKYGDSKGNVAADTNLLESFNRWYSSEFIDYEEIDDGTTAANPVQLDSADASAQPFQWLPVHPAEDAKGYVTSITYVNNGDSQSYTLVDDGAGNIVTAGGTAVGTINYTTGAWSIDLTPAAHTFKTGEPTTATYYYDQERVNESLATGTQRSKIPELNFDVAVQEIKAKRRSMKFRTSTEAMDDLRAFHGQDAEQELVAGMGNQMALGLDREIVDDLVNGAKWGATYTHGPNFGGQPVLTELESIRQLQTIIGAVSAAILKGSNRGHANFVVVGPEVGNFLSQMTQHGDFQAINKFMQPEVAPGYGVLNSQFGVHQIGTLLNRYMVYEDPFIDPNTILVGLRGRTYIDAGYVYAPFIPMEVTPSFLDPDDLSIRKGIRTRYATRMLRPEYYGVITVSGLPTVTINP